jgi:hypothetical protein
MQGPGDSEHGVGANSLLIGVNKNQSKAKFWSTELWENLSIHIEYDENMEAAKQNRRLEAPCRAKCTVRHVIQACNPGMSGPRSQNERFLSPLIFASNKSYICRGAFSRLLSILVIQQVLPKGTDVPYYAMNP